MATLTYQQATFGGLTPTLAAATATVGDSVVPDDHGAFLILNGSGSAVTATLVVPGNTKYGIANPDPTISIAAGAQKLIGPLPADLADPTTGLATVICSSVTSVTIGAVRI